MKPLAELITSMLATFLVGFSLVFGGTVGLYLGTALMN